MAIAGDYNLGDSAEYSAAEATLQSLAQSVPIDGATGFNPSGVPALPDGGSDGLADEATTTASLSRPASQTNATDFSSADSNTADFGPTPPRLTSLDGDSPESKALLLQSMFSGLKAFDIEYSLKKANGNLEAALDDLLNLEYLQSTGQQAKGVDAFFAADDAPCSRSKRSKAKKGAGSGKSSSGQGRSDSGGECFASRGAASVGAHTLTRGRPAQDDIQYIAERFGMRSDQVSAAYHKAGCSKGATAVELLDQLLSHGIQSQDEAGKAEADKLARKYRHVPERYMLTIVHVAGSIPQFAGDVACLVNKHFSKQPKSTRLDISYSLAPLAPGEIEGTGAVAVARRASAAAAASGRAAPAAMSSCQALEAANKHRQARMEAMSSAAQLRRKGGSSGLYRQAVGYYTDQAREQARYAQQAVSTAADLWVEEQRTASAIDLHGVEVRDGVRIARQKTQEWWQGLGEFRSKKAKEQGGFTVITGLGRHSAGGMSQLRAAVAAALVQDGWRVRVETGKFVVEGRR